MAFAGNHEGRKWSHASFFEKLTIGDTLFMYHSKKDKRRLGGFLSRGIVLERWDRIAYEGENCMLYKGENPEEIYEYRIQVKWKEDWRSKPKMPSEISDPSLFITPRYFYHIDESKYEILMDI